MASYTMDEYHRYLVPCCVCGCDCYIGLDPKEWTMDPPPRCDSTCSLYRRIMIAIWNEHLWACTGCTYCT